MLVAVNGYIEGNRVIVEENLADWQGREVIVTILNKTRDERTVSVKKTAEDERKNAAIMEIFGLWKDHDDNLSVEEMVRNMRRGRCFDS